TTGMVLIAVGCALNVLVIVVNQGMPVASDALLSAGAEMPHDPLHVVLGEATRLPALGDIIPVGPFHSVYSVGDLAIAIGGFAVPVALAAGLPLAVPYLCVFAAAVCAAVFNPARISMVPQLVRPERLTEANSRLGSTDRIVEILGSVVAGLLVASLGAGAFYFD